MERVVGQVPAARFTFRAAWCGSHGMLTPMSPAPVSRTLGLLPLLVCAAWASTRWYRHVDISDASLYRVIARHLVEDDAWLSLRYLPTAYPRFFEHLPFGVWPMAAWVRVFGEASLAVLPLGLSLATVWLVGQATRRLAGDGAALLAMTTLALTQNFFFIASLTLLDVPLLFGGALALAGLCRERIDRWFAVLTWAGTLIGVATKGPFGLLTPGAMLAARVVVGVVRARAGASEERPGWVALVGGGALALAVLPVAAFVASSPDWLEHYGRAQVLGSITGARADGDGGRLFAVQKLGEMFWPGLACLPFAWPWLRHRLFGPSSPRERRASAVAALACLVLVVGLSLPARKVAHHVFVAFPLLSLFSGVALGPGLERLLARSTRWVRGGLLGFAFAGVVAGPLGVARFFCGPPCVMSTEFSAAFDAIPPGTGLELVTTDPWPMLSALTAERRLVPVHVGELGRNAQPWALVAEPLWTSPPQYEERGRARGWVLAKRRE